MKNKLLVLLFTIMTVMVLQACSEFTVEKENMDDNGNEVVKVDKVPENNLKAENNQQNNEENNTEVKTGNKQEVKNTYNNSKDISYEVGFTNATLTKVTDGDTIKVKMNGKEYTVRLLLIDTPETVSPKEPVQLFGPEASAYAKEFFKVGDEIQLEFDVSGKSTDKYGRLLAYAWKDGKMYNEEVVKKGLARVAYIYAPNTRHVDLLYAVQKEAQSKALGIWSVEDYATDKGYDMGVVEDESTTSNNQSVSSNSNNVNNSQSNGCLNIKGNISSSGDKIYHQPGGAFYEQTKEEEMFCSIEEAENAGFRASKR